MEWNGMERWMTMVGLVNSGVASEVTGSWVGDWVARKCEGQPGGEGVSAEVQGFGWDQSQSVDSGGHVLWPHRTCLCTSPLPYHFPRPFPDAPRTSAVDLRTLFARGVTQECRGLRTMGG
jgi:hypothetical protein